MNECQPLIVTTRSRLDLNLHIAQTLVFRLYTGRSNIVISSNSKKSNWSQEIANPPPIEHLRKS